MKKEEIQEKIGAAADPSEAFGVIRMFFSYLCSEEGMWIHFNIAATILEKEKISDSEALNMFAGNLFEKCAQIGQCFDVAHAQDFYRKSLFIWDWVFLDQLIKLGSAGRVFAKKIAIKLESYCRSKESVNLLGHWFVEPNEELQVRYFHSPVFLILAEAVWLDLVKNLWIRKKKMFQPSPKVYGSPL